MIYFSLPHNRLSGKTAFKAGVIRLSRNIIFIGKGFIFSLKSKMKHVALLLLLFCAGFAATAQIGPEWKVKVPIDINNAFIDDHLADWTLVFDQSFSSVLTQVNGPLDADGTAPSLNGGDDVRFSTDIDGLNELAVDIRNWVTNTKPTSATCEIAVKIPSVSKDDNTTIYMWWGNASATKAKPVDPFGQYNAYDANYRAVWTDGGKTERTRHQSNGVNNGGISPGGVDGKVGSATVFDGSVNYFTVPNSGNLNFANGVGLTMSAIVKTPGGTGATQVIIDGRDVNSSWSGMGFTIGATGYFGGYLSDDNVVSTAWSSNTPADDDTWRQVVATYADNEIGKTYLNGALSKESTIAEINIKNNAPNLNIGFRNPPTSAWSNFKGSIDEFRISSVTRNEAWIKATYHNQFNSPGFLTFDPIINCSSPAMVGLDNITPTTGTGLNGSITISITSGSAPYTVELVETGATTVINFEGGSHTFNGLEPGTYSILVTDNNPCETFVSEIVLPNQEDCEIGSLYSYRVPISIDNSFIDEELSNWTLVFDQTFSSMLTLDNGPLDADGSATSLNGGADIRFSSDIDGNNVLARDIRKWETSSDPTAALCEVAVKIPTVNSGSTTTIYMWWGNPAAVEPAPTDACGQYNAYDNDHKGVWADGGGTDRTNNTNNGTPSAGLSIGGVNGKMGVATAYNGSSDFVQVTDNNSIDFDDEITISVWAYRTGTAANRWMKLISKWNNYFLALDNIDVEAGIYGAVWDTDATAVTTLDRTTTLPINSWHKLELVYSETSGQVKLYLDNALIVSDPSASIVTSDLKLLFGKSELAVENQYYNGFMDEIRLSSVARSDAWRNAEYHNQFNTTGFLSFGAIDYCLSPVAINVDNIDQTSGAGSNGSIDLSITGGTAPYTVELIETGATTIVNTDGGTCSFTGLEAGTYSVSVNDNNACAATESNIVVQNAQDCQIGSAYLYNLPITIDNTFIYEDLTNWTLVFDQSFAPALIQINGPLDADGSAASLNGGADIRFSSDPEGNDVLGRDIRRWETNTDPLLAFCEVAVKVPVVYNASTTTIYMWWGNPAAVEPPPTDNCGQYNAYDDDHFVVSAIGSEINRTRYAIAMTPLNGLVSGNANGKVGNATDYAGELTQQAVEMTSVPTFDNTIKYNTPYTLEILANNENPAIGVPQFMVAKMKEVDDYRGWYMFYSSGKFLFGFHGDNSPLAQVLKYKNFVMNQNQWYHMAGTYDGSNDADGMSLYIDGLLQIGTTEDEDGTVTGFDHAYPALIGARGWQQPNGQREWNGKLDELRIHTAERSTAWLKANYHNLFNTPDFLSFGEITATVNPGGVTTDLQLWLRADEEAYVTGTTPAADEQAVETWHSQGLLNADAEQTDAAKKPIYKENAINNNPALFFNGLSDFMRTPNIMPGITSSYSGFVVVKKQSTSTAKNILAYQNADWGQLWSYGETSGNDNFTIYSKSPGSWNWNYDGTQPIVTSTQILSSVWSTTSNLNYYANGTPKGTYTEPNSITNIPNNSRIIVGGRGLSGSEADFQQYFDGLIAEVIYYERPLSLFEQEKVQSYLSIKYGLTKLSADNATTPEDERDYFASDGTIIWDQSANTGFNQIITAIGRDDASGLTQSKSRNTAEHSGITLEKTGLFGTNQSFIFSGSNNETGASFAAPTGYEVRSKRVWKVNTTGTPGAIDLTFHTDVFGFVQGTDVSEYALLIDSDGDFTAGATIVTDGAAFSGNDLSFTNVNLSDGDYLAIAKMGVKAPGQVYNGLRLWLKADEGVIGSPVLSWQDQSIYGFLAEASANPPALVEDALNSNPILRFDESAKTHFCITGGILKNSPSNDLWVYYVSKANNTNRNSIFSENLANTEYLGALNAWSNSNVYFQLGNSLTTAGGGRIQGLWGGELGTYHLWTGGISASGISPNSTYKTVYRDGEAILTNTNTTDMSIQSAGNPLYIGGRWAGNDDYYLDGDLAELIIYTEVPSALEQEKIHSYLSLKYGLTKQTIDNASTPEDERDYFASDGSVIWDYSAMPGYQTGIVGIGRDDEQVLDRRISQSQTSNAALTLSKNAVFADDLSFMIASSNFEDGIDYTNAPAGYAASSKRIWKVSSRGTPGDIDLDIDLSTMNFSVSGDVANYVLITDTDDDFTSGATLVSTGLSLNGNVLNVDNITLASNSYFAIGTVSTPGPADVSGGLELWYRFEPGDYANNAAITEWQDRSPTGGHASQPASSQRPKFKSEANTAFNFEPFASFDGTDDRLAVNHFYNAKDIDQIYTFVAFRTTYNTPGLSSNWAFLDFDRSEFFNVYVEGDGRAAASYIGTALHDIITTSPRNDGIAHIAGFAYDNAKVVDEMIWSDGALEHAADSEPLGTKLGKDGVTRYAFIGDGSEAETFNGAANNAYYSGQIAEIIAYRNNSLTSQEINKIHSYLAIKYGADFTMVDDGATAGFDESNFHASDDSEIWNKTTNAGYNFKIAGLGIDGDGNLTKIKSRSAYDELKLTFEKQDDYSNSLSYLVWGADNGSTTKLVYSDNPVGTFSRMERIYRVQELDQTGLLNVSFDLLPTQIANGPVLLIDANDATGGDFSDATVINTGITISGNTVTVSGINPEDGEYLAIGFENEDYDWLAGAYDITSLIGDCSNLKEFSTLSASSDETAPSCHPDGGAPISNRWFKMTVPVSGKVDVTVINNSNIWGSMQSTVITLYDDLLNEIKCVEGDALNKVNTRMYQDGLTSGDLVFISVDVASAGDEGTFSLCLNPGFDEPSYAKTITVNGCLNDQFLIKGVHTVSPIAHASCFGGTEVPDVWYTFVAPASGFARIELQGSFNGLANISLWDQNGTTQLACAEENDAVAPQVWVIQRSGLTPGKKYIIEVTQWSGGWNWANKGPFSICVYDEPDNDNINNPRDITAAIDGCMGGDSEFSSCQSTSSNPGSCFTGFAGERWFNFTVPPGGITRIEVTETSNQINFYMNTVLYRKSTMQEVMCNHYSSSAGGVITMNTQDLLIEGEEYLLGVARHSSPCGNFSICMETYDTQEGAYVIPNLASYCSTDKKFSTVDASADGPNQSCNPSNKVADRFFEIPVPASDEVLVEVKCNSAAYGSMKNPILTLYNSSWVPIACQTYLADGDQSTFLCASGLTGTKVYLGVDVEDNVNWGDFTLCLYDAIMSVDNIAITAETCDGENDGSFTVTMENAPLDLGFSIDGADYTNATGMFNNLSPGSYTLTIKSLSQGCVYTHPTPVVVPVGNPLPTPADPAIVVCPEDANPYNLTAHDNAVLDGDVGTVAWFDGDPEVAGVAIADPTDVDLAAITDLWAQVTLTATSCIASVDASSTINPLPAVTFGGYQYSLPITIKADKVNGTEDLVDFPLLVSVVLDETHVANTSGFDIIFTDINGSALSHEVESYNNANGELRAWVRIPSLSTSVDTEIKVLYGNTEIGSDQSNPTDVWSARYSGVWHFENSFSDATIHGIDGTNEGTTNIAGQIGQARNYVTGQYITLPDNNTVGFNVDQFVFSAWIQIPDLTNQHPYMWIGNTGPVVENAFYATAVNSTEIPRLFVRDLVDLYSFNANNPISINDWHYIVNIVDFAAATDNLSIYVDGVFDGSTTIALSPDYSSGVPYERMRFGTDPLASTFFFEGLGDEFRALRSGLSAGWIKTEYDNQLDPTTFLSIGTETVNAQLPEVCINDAPIILVGGTPAGGDYSGPGVSFNGSDYVFDPSVSAGTFTLTYTYTDANTCPNSATSDMTVVPAPAAPTVTNVVACQGTFIADLTAMGTNVIWYSDAALTNQVGVGNSFNALQTFAGVYTYYATQSTNGGCESPGTTATLTINTVDNSFSLSDESIEEGHSATIRQYGSEAGVSYQLRLEDGDSDVGTAKEPGGGEFLFDDVSPTSTTEYNVLATSTITGCSVQLLATATVTVTDIPLPVELLTFMATDQLKSVKLDWTTASETDNDYFSVERSLDGEFWSEIGQVKGSGTTTSVTAYTFTDHHPVVGYQYYRLRQVDFDGEFEYSKVILVLRSGDSSFTLDVYPVPLTSEELFLATDGDAVITGLTLVDATGKQTPLVVNSVRPGLTSTTIRQTAGVYVIIVDTSKGQIRRAIVVY
jgi:hypothetical protein